MNSKKLSLFILFFSVYSFGSDQASSSNQDVSLNEEFLTAAKTGDTAKLQNLLLQGVDIECKDELGNTALGLACICNDKEDAALLLIKQGANVNIEYHNIDNSGSTKTPLEHICVNSDKLEVLKKLLLKLIKKPDQNTINYALHTAINKQDLNSIEFFIKHGSSVNINVKNPQTQAVLSYLSFYVEEYCRLEKLKNNNTDQIKAQFIQESIGFTKELINILLKSGALVNNVELDGRTAMHIAIENESDYLTKLLFACGATIPVLAPETINHLSANNKPLFDTLRLLSGYEKEVIDRLTLTTKVKTLEGIRDVHSILPYIQNLSVAGGSGRFGFFFNTTMNLLNKMPNDQNIRRIILTATREIAKSCVLDKRNNFAVELPDELCEIILEEELRLYPEIAKNLDITIKLKSGEERSIRNLIFDNIRNIVERVMNNRIQVQMARRGMEAEDRRATLARAIFNGQHKRKIILPVSAAKRIAAAVAE